jgi:hypothetical protein
MACVLHREPWMAHADACALNGREPREAPMKTRIGAALGLAAGLAACAYNPPPIPLEGRAADLEALAGEWGGEYEGENGRSGTIAFELVAGEDHAHGDVLMVPRGASEPVVAWNDPGHEARGAGLPEVLSIRFVAAESGEVSGALDPYFDPDCRCKALTRFRGWQRGDVIEGTYTLYNEGSPVPVHGTWKVRRKRP